MSKDLPGVGVGVIIQNSDGQILVGKRKGSFASGMYCIPGGRVELGETFERTAIREIKEEVGLEIIDPKVIAVTNNLETYRSEGVHFISVVLFTDQFKGLAKNMEPSKCEEILWVDPRMLPQPHFDASRLAVECFLNDKVYSGISN